jgi:hypothetical protein
MKRFWEWFDREVMFRDMQRLDNFLCHPWFVPGYFLAVFAVICAGIFAAS